MRTVEVDIRAYMPVGCFFMVYFKEHGWVYAEAVQAYSNILLAKSVFNPNIPVNLNGHWLRGMRQGFIQISPN